MKDLESVYDAEIAPLMKQIIDIAKEHDMPFVACFQLNDGTAEHTTPLLCTSAQLPVGCEIELRRAYEHVGPDRAPTVIAFVVHGPRGGSYRDN